MRRLLAVLLLAGTVCAQDLPELWSHVYHPGRLRVRKARATVTGVIVDATAGKNKDGCRHEADGDGHCWLKLDPDQEQFLNQGNFEHQQGNLVYEPICRYRVTQADAIEACKDFRQDIVIPPLGSHVRLTGSSVLDTQHGHLEFHPLSAVDVIPEKIDDRSYHAEVIQ